MIAVLPYVIHPKTAVLGRAGGGVFLLSLTFLLKKQSDVFIPYYEMTYRLLMMPLACLALDFF